MLVVDREDNPRRTLHAGYCAVLVLVLCDASAIAQQCDFTQVDTAMTNMVAAVALMPGASIRIGTADEVLHEAYFGTYDANTVVRLASASKILSAAAVMSVVDDGLLGLDQPVNSVLPEFAGTNSSMTLRQMFSHTTGLPGGSNWDVLSDNMITLEEAVQTIACCVAPEAAPSTQFSYGGLSMHVGGRMVEAASGQLFSELFAARIANPLGMTATDYEAFGPTTNPRIAGGARTNLHDYGVFMEMFLRGGVHNGATILSLASVNAMFADQRGGLPEVEIPEGVGEGGYGLGIWRESTDAIGNVIRASDPGAFGFTPWFEMDRRVYGIIMIDFIRTPLIPALQAIQNLVRNELDRCNAQGSALPAVPSGTAATRVALALALLGIGWTRARLRPDDRNRT